MTCSGTAEAAKGRRLNEDRERIIKLFDSCKDDTGFISYKKSVGLREKLESYMNDVVRGELLGELRYRDAFDMTSFIMEEICRLSIDDAGSITESLMYRCKYTILHIIDKSGDD